MRCSMRESYILPPLMFTSTPISKRRKPSAFNFFKNSPIYKSNPDLLAVPKALIKYQNQNKEQITVFKVCGNEKIPLIKERRGTSFQKSALSHPPMVVISDSEEEDKSDIYSEVTVPSNSNLSSRRKSVRMDMDQLKENRCRNRNALKSLKGNFFENVNKKGQKRISRVATILDEIMKERKSTILSPSPLVNLKSELSADAIVEEEEKKKNLEIQRLTRSSASMFHGFKNVKGDGQKYAYEPNALEEGVVQTKTVEVAGKLQDIGNLNDINNIRITRKRAQSIKKKENEIPHQEDNLLKELVAGKTLKSPKQKHNCIDLEKKEIVFYNQEDVSDGEWIQVDGQTGVFVKKNFHILNISNGFVKIEAKCSLVLQSIRSQVFSFAEGRGIIEYHNNSMKVKIGPGQTVLIPAGVSCKVINSGLKKNLIFSFVKIYSE